MRTHINQIKTRKLYEVIKILQDKNRFMEYKREMYIDKIKQLEELKMTREDKEKLKQRN